MTRRDRREPDTGPCCNTRMQSKAVQFVNTLAEACSALRPVSRHIAPCFRNWSFIHENEICFVFSPFFMAPVFAWFSSAGYLTPWCRGSASIMQCQARHSMRKYIFAISSTTRTKCVLTISACADLQVRLHFLAFKCRAQQNSFFFICFHFTLLCRS